MYSRFSGKNENVRLPEHYGGCAFSPQQAPPPPRQAHPSIGKPTPPPTPPPPPPSEEPRETPRKESIPDEIPNKEKHSPALPALRLGNLGVSFPFSHGIGFEELLILGLILLLSQNGEERDVVLILALLLFCG